MITNNPGYSISTSLHIWGQPYDICICRENEGNIINSQSSKKCYPSTKKFFHRY